MDQLQKTVANTGSRIRRIDKTKKILLIGSAKNAALLNRQETYRVYQCDTVRQAWSLIYRHRPHLVVLNLADSAPRRSGRAPPAPGILAERRVRSMPPEHLTRSLAEALEHQAMAVIPASSIARSIGKVLQSVV